MEIKGTIQMIGETYEVGSNGFSKRDLIIKTEENYPQVFLIEFIKDKTSLLDNFSYGDFVQVEINLRGREWTNPEGEKKYFTSLSGWKIEYPSGAKNLTKKEIKDEEDNDGLPF